MNTQDNTSLQTLYLSGNNIGDEGAKALSAALKVHCVFVKVVFDCDCCLYVCVGWYAITSLALIVEMGWID